MYRPAGSFGRSSPLFWLSLTVAAGIIFIGARFLLSPLVAAEAFGVPLVSGEGVAFAYTKGIRDIFAGLVLIPFLWRGQRRAVAWIMLLAIIIPVADGLTVLRFSGFQFAFLSIHWGTALFLAVLAALLFRDGRKDDIARKLPTTGASPGLRKGQAGSLRSNDP